MANTLPLDKMTVEEKLQAMESLWDDLCRRGEVVSPEWHGEALQQRDAAYKRGDDSFQDWEATKKAIRDRTS